jgi:hypothetical protein
MHQLDGLPVGGGDLVPRVAKLVAPIGACPPGWALQDEAEAILFRDGDIALIVAH